MSNSILYKGADLVRAAIVSAGLLGASSVIMAQTQERCITTTSTEITPTGKRTIVTSICPSTEINPSDNDRTIISESITSGKIVTRYKRTDGKICTDTMTAGSISTLCDR